MLVTEEEFSMHVNSLVHTLLKLKDKSNHIDENPVVYVEVGTPGSYKSCYRWIDGVDYDESEDALVLYLHSGFGYEIPNQDLDPRACLDVLRDVSDVLWRRFAESDAHNQLLSAVYELEKLVHSVGH